MGVTIIFVYKITNQINGKFYIGQTKNSIENRFKRHINDAISNRLNTHLAKAIRKYGSENFYIETIDVAYSQEDLTEKEYFWINYYQSHIYGYNETNSKNKCGGNTYKNKSPEEIMIIKEKISKSKQGINNNNHTAVKCKNIKSNEEFHFNTMKEMCTFFNEKNHAFIYKRCKHKISYLYKGEWMIAYENDDYYEFKPYKSIKRSKAIKVIDMLTSTEKYFESFAAAENFYKLKPKEFSGRAYKKGNCFTIKNRYKIYVLNKSVSTIPDECMEVGVEISTTDVIGNETSENRSGRLLIFFILIDDIVSANGNIR